MSKEDVSVSDKVTQIMSTHNASINGLKLKNGELIGSEKKLKDSIAEYEKGKTDYETTIADLKKQIENAGGNDKVRQEYYENELAKVRKGYDAQILTLTNERDEFKKYKLETLKRTAIEKGIEGIRFADDFLKEGFIALCEKEHNFKATDIDGTIRFLDENNKDITDVLKEMALSEKGKSYIANTVSGGKDSNSYSAEPLKNADGKIDIQKLMQMYSNPATREKAKKAMIEAGMKVF